MGHRSKKHHHPAPPKPPSKEKKVLEKILEVDERIERTLEHIEHDLRHPPQPLIPTHIRFTEITMAPTAAGQAQTFTGTLTPAGAIFPTDSTFGVTSNDPAVSPSVDSTGLIVSVTYPDGWVESTTTPLAFSYSASSASTGMSLSATITPSAPPAVVPTGISFTQTS